MVEAVQGYGHTRREFQAVHALFGIMALHAVIDDRTRSGVLAH